MSSSMISILGILRINHRFDEIGESECETFMSYNSSKIIQKKKFFLKELLTDLFNLNFQVLIDIKL